MKTVLTTGEIYHIFNRSIAEFKIFKSHSDFSRIKEAIQYYQIQKRPFSFTYFNKIQKNITKHKRSKSEISIDMDKNNKLVQIIAYCIMPTHIHLVLKELGERGVVIFMSNLLNSYSRYFNIKHKRKGPLWEGRFKRVLVENDEQLLHLTRYIHLNPVTAYLVNKPEDWEASSYKEYLSNHSVAGRICRYNDILNINPTLYKQFTEDRIFSQRELAKINNQNSTS